MPSFCAFPNERFSEWTPSLPTENNDLSDTRQFSTIVPKQSNGVILDWFKSDESR